MSMHVSASAASVRRVFWRACVLQTGAEGAANWTLRQSAERRPDAMLSALPWRLLWVPRNRPIQEPALSQTQKPIHNPTPEPAFHKAAEGFAFQRSIFAPRRSKTAPLVGLLPFLGIYIFFFSNLIRIWICIVSLVYLSISRQFVNVWCNAHVCHTRENKLCLFS